MPRPGESNRLGSPLPVRLASTPGDIPERDLWHTFNLGIGFCLVVPEDQTNLAIETCRAQQLEAWTIGSIVQGNPEDGVIGLPD
jgi:phosphoribosylformylglycinamidine cyclo-ligase